VVIQDVTFLPVAKPYQAGLTKGENGIEIKATLPDERTATDFAQSAGKHSSFEYTLASGMPDADWTQRLLDAKPLLDDLEAGSVQLVDKVLVVTGKAIERSAQDDFKVYGDSLADGYTLDYSAVKFPEPFNFNISRSSEGSVTLAGLAPKGTDLQQLISAFDGDVNTQGLKLEADGEPSDVLDKLAAIAPVLADLKTFDVAFNQLKTPTFDVTGAVLPNADLEQFATNRTAAKLDNADIEMPRPFDVQFSLDATKGAQLVGLAPEGFDAQALAESLGLPKINTDDFGVGARGDSDALSEQISGLKPVLEDVETLEVGLEGVEDSKPDVKAETLPNADPERVAGFLKDIFVNLTEVDVAPTKNVYTNGQQRVNGITGVKEQYQSGYWIPLVTVTDASQAACKSITDSILEDRQIEFKSGLAKLDASSRVVINRLAGVVSSCLEQTPLLVELGGHTDSDGEELANLNLSIERVNVVSDALVIRGVDPERIEAIGYGEIRPIADNATPEGRRKNRRTEFDWLNQVQP